jgi:hypothetical protein
MLPPDFEERKRAALHQSGLIRFFHRLREHGLDPDSLLSRPAPVEDQESLGNALRSLLGIDSRAGERVAGWKEAAPRVMDWLQGRAEVAVFYNDGGQEGWLVVPAAIAAAHIDAFHAAAGPGGALFLVTPGGSGGMMYFEDEHENLFAVWGDA